MTSASVRLVAYLRDLTLPRLVLWCYLIWYLNTLARYFDPSPRIWITSLGISCVSGCGLYLNTALSGKVRLRLEGWQLFRLFLMPFCVSSFAALAKDKGFVLVFNPRLMENAVGLAACAAFAGATALAKRADNVGRAAVKQPLTASQGTSGR